MAVSGITELAPVGRGRPKNQTTASRLEPSFSSHVFRIARTVKSLIQNGLGSRAYILQFRWPVSFCEPALEDSEEELLAEDAD